MGLLAAGPKGFVQRGLNLFFNLSVVVFAQKVVLFPPCFVTLLFAGLDLLCCWLP